MELAKEAGLLDRSTLFFYEAIEYEPSVPAATLQFADIRDYMKKELALSPGARGCFGNAETPIMVLPNIYFFARCAQDPSYIDRPDEKILADFAQFLGGPPELLVPAWSCLHGAWTDCRQTFRRNCAAELTSPAAALLPGGAKRLPDHSRRPGRFSNPSAASQRAIGQDSPGSRRGHCRWHGRTGRLVESTSVRRRRRRNRALQLELR